MGPYSKEDLVLLAKNGDVSRDAQICPEGSNQWSGINTILPPKSNTAPINIPESQRRKPMAPTAPPPSAANKIAGPRIANMQYAQTYLQQLRENSCYSTLRSLITIVTVVSMMALIASAIVMAFVGLQAGSIGPCIVSGAMAILGAFLLVAARQASLLMIDLVDAQLERNSQH